MNLARPGDGKTTPLKHCPPDMTEAEWAFVAPCFVRMRSDVPTQTNTLTGPEGGLYYNPAIVAGRHPHRRPRCSTFPRQRFRSASSMSQQELMVVGR